MSTCGESSLSAWLWWVVGILVYMTGEWLGFQSTWLVSGGNSRHPDWWLLKITAVAVCGKWYLRGEGGLRITDEVSGASRSAKLVGDGTQFNYWCREVGREGREGSQHQFMWMLVTNRKKEGDPIALTLMEGIGAGMGLSQVRSTQAVLLNCAVSGKGCLHVYVLMYLYFCVSKYTVGIQGRGRLLEYSS